MWFAEKLKRSAQEKSLALMESLHGRQLSDTKFLQSYSTQDKDIDILLTASEDTTANIVQINYSQQHSPQLSVLKNLKAHVGNVKCLATSTTERGWQTLVFSAGSRAQIVAWLVTVERSKDFIHRMVEAHDDGELRADVERRLREDHTHQDRGADREIAFSSNLATNQDSCVMSKSQVDKKDAAEDEDNNLGVKVVLDTTEYNQMNEEDLSHASFFEGTSVQKNNNIAQHKSGSKTKNSHHSSLNLAKANSYNSQIGDAKTPTCSYEILGTYMITEKLSKRHKPWKKKTLADLPETRFMDITCFQMPSTVGVYFVAAACSDGYIRLFAFHKNKSMMQTVSKSHFHNHCVLKVGNFVLKNSILLYSALTDGKIAFWDVTHICIRYLQISGHHLVDTKKHFQYDDLVVNDYEYEVQREGRKSSSSASSPTTDYTAENKDGFTDSYQITADSRSFANDGTSATIGSDGIVVKIETESESESDDEALTQEAEINLNTWQNVEVAQSDMDLGQPLHVMKAHQSGVNAVDVLILTDDSALVASGGDDNALHLYKVQLRDTHDMTSVEVLHKQDAHSAQITGVTLVSPDILVTAAKDQRVCVWRVSEHEITMSACKLCNTSDISSMSIWRHRDGYRIGVYGDGLDILTFHL